jgi:hypothetical protein
MKAKTIAKINLSVFTAKRLERMGKSPEAAIKDYLKGIEAQEAAMEAAAGRILEKGRSMTIYKDKLYTMVEFAKVIRSTKYSVINYRREGRFHFIKMGGKYLITGEELAYIKEHGLRPSTPEWRKKAREQKRGERARKRKAAGA